MTLLEKLALVLLAAPIAAIIAAAVMLLAARLTPRPVVHRPPSDPDPMPEVGDRGETAFLRRVVGDAPLLIWREGADGEVNWANAAYLALAAPPDLLDHGGTGWPLPRLFADPGPDLGKPRRQRLMRSDGKSGPWHEITSASDAEGTLHFAIEVEAVVEAERARRDFVQTLAKTFAELSIGLAIFDRQRRLILFNPALTELTGLAPGFLAGRPTLQTMLDRMREARRLPEPKNYATWRQEMAACEAEARRGGCLETWALPNGQTLRVTGRPHPDGAVAFLFEDISADVTLTRSFRAEIEATHDALDIMDDAIAVFAASGTLVLANRAYHVLWGMDAEALSDPSLHDHLRLWQNAGARTPVDLNARTAVETEVDMQAAGRWRLRLTPLPKGATLARLEPLTSGAGIRRAAG